MEMINISIIFLICIFCWVPIPPGKNKRNWYLNVYLIKDISVKNSFRNFCTNNSARNILDLIRIALSEKHIFKGPTLNLLRNLKPNTSRIYMERLSRRSTRSPSSP